jgi:hypothetical protein
MTYTSPILSAADQRFFDVTWEAEADATGNLCGMLPPPDELMGYSPDYEASQTVYPESEWPDRIAAIDASGGWMEQYIREILNQGREPSCVYNAAAQAMHIVQAKQWGVENVRLLSPISGYRYNGSPRSGSSVPGAAVWMESTGLLPRKDDPRVVADIAAGHYQHSHPATGYSVTPPGGWKDTARCFRSHEWLKINTVAGFITAEINGEPIVGGRDGHALCQIRPLIDGRTVSSMYVNSWGAWGSSMAIHGGKTVKGFGFDSRRKIEAMVSRGAWALRSVVRPSWLTAKG